MCVRVLVWFLFFSSLRNINNKNKHFFTAETKAIHPVFKIRKQKSLTVMYHLITWGKILSLILRVGVSETSALAPGFI